MIFTYLQNYSWKKIFMTNLSFRLDILDYLSLLPKINNRELIHISKIVNFVIL